MGVTRKPEYFDVIIVGAGISGIGSAFHLHDQCPGKSFLVLEEMESFGGTWLTHTYPGVRSDSDLYTFGYRFKPWTKAPIASAEEILHYLGEVIFENDLDRRIRYKKDINTISETSKSFGLELPMIKKAEEVYENAVKEGLGHLDYTGILEYIKKLNEKN